MNAAVVENLLRRTHRLTLAAELACRSALVCCALVVGILSAMLIDALFSLGTAGLLALDAMLIALATGACIYLGARIAAGRYHPRRMAVMVEQRLGITDSRLINSVDLAGLSDVPRDHIPGAGAGAGVSIGLRDLALAQGASLAAELSPRASVDHFALRRSGRQACLALLVVIVAYLLTPCVFHAVLPRLLAPYAELAPFTLVRFDLTITPVPAVFGQPASIRVKLEGPQLPHRASAVFDSDAVSHRRYLPMLRSTDGDSTDDSNSSATHFVLRFDKAQNSGRFFIDTPEGRSRWYPFPVLPVPQFERVTVGYAYPPYTGWPDRTERLGTAGIQALAGTEVTLTVTSNIALREGSFVRNGQPDDDRITLKADHDQPRTVLATFAVKTSGLYKLAITGTDGTPSSDTLTIKVESILDQPPQVTIVAPPVRVIVPVGWPVDVRIEARDDVGVGRLVLHRSVNGWTPVAVDLATTGTDRTEVFADYRFDLADLGARRGDVITYFATVYDQYPDLPQVAQSAIHVISVISKEEYFTYARSEYRMEELLSELAAFEAALEQLQQQRKALLEELQALQDQLDQGEKLSAADLQRMRDLEAQVADYAAQADALAQQMKARAEQPPLYDFEQPYQRMLAELSDALVLQARDAAAIAAALGQLAESDSAQQRRALASETQRLMDNDKPFGEGARRQRDRVEGDFEKYFHADAIMSQAERIRAVVQEQQELAERMSTFGARAQLDRSEQRLADNLAQQQELLRQELRAAQGALRQAAEAARQVLPGMSRDAVGICDAIDSMQIDRDQRDARQSAGAGRGKDAYRSAQAAADKLDSLLVDVDQAASQGEGEMCDALSLPRSTVAASMQQLAQGRSLPGLGQRTDGSAGTRGSRAQVTVMGPATMRTAASESRTGQSMSTGRGRAAGSGTGVDAQGEPAELLTPAETTQRGYGATAMPGVPLQFQSEAEAYFRRLAEETR